MSLTRIMCEGCGFPQVYCRCVPTQAMPSRREVLAAVVAAQIAMESELPPFDEQEFLQVLNTVQERHEAGGFRAEPDVCLLVHRVPRLFAELLRLRMENLELRQERELASRQDGLFSTNPNSR